jgi:hypothetical protein
LSNWINGSRVPLMRNFFKIEEFLKKQTRARKRATKPEFQNP